jgi:photosystem II stability/assembly factor-like uncharacterized protein
MKKATIFAFACLVFAGLAQTGPTPDRGKSLDGAATWQPIGPEGGTIAALASAKNNPADVIALICSSYSGPSFVFRSRDGGYSWAKAARIEAALFDLKRVPSDPSTVYALAKDRFFKSSDGGITWTSVLFDSKFFTYGKIAIDPRTPRRVFLSGSYKYKSYNTCMAVYLSNDGGANWTVNQVFPTTSTGQANPIAIDSLKPTTLYLGGYSADTGTSQVRLCKSTDGGATWTDITGTISSSFNAIAVDPVNSKNVFVACDSGLYRSANGGASWLETSVKSDAFSLAVDPDNPKTIYAGGNNKILKTVDGGLTWKSYSTGLYGRVGAWALGSAGPLAGTSAGLYASADAGKTWRPSQRGIELTSAWVVAFAPSAPENLYVSTSGGSFHSLDGGGGWGRMSDISDDSDNYLAEIAVHPSAPHLLYAINEGETADGALYRTLNGGQSWKKILAPYVSRVRVQNTNPGFVFAATIIRTSGGKYVMSLHISSDGGDHWIKRPVPATWSNMPYAMSCHPTDPEVVYLGAARMDKYRGVIYKTTDGGESWKLISYTGHSGDYPYSMAVDPHNPSRILMGTPYGIYRSEDDGQTWSLRKTTRSASSIVFDPKISGAVYLGWSNGVLRSFDGGKNWQSFNQGLTILNVESLALDSEAKILYAATIGGGVFKRAL